MNQINNPLNKPIETPYTGHPHDTRRAYTKEEMARAFKIPDAFDINRIFDL